MDADDRLALVQSHVAQLAEHFDTVQVFVTRVDEGGDTGHVSWGAGNWFARFGHVNHWLARQEAIAAAGEHIDECDD
jgi:hypothetical protein